jgi:hypothetical protein
MLLEFEKSPEVVEVEQAMLGKTVTSVEEGFGVVKFHLSDRTTIEFWADNFHIEVNVPFCVRAEFSERE